MLTIKGIGNEFKEMFNNDFYNNINELYNVNFSITVVWNSRLKTTAGRCRISNFDETVIELNPKYNKFSKERILGTFRHEMAHAISYKIYGSKGHSDIFKIICKNIGGTMNEQMASDRYKDCATDQYITSQDKYKYTCPKCGQVMKRKRKISKKVLSTHVCNKCKEKVSKFKCEFLRR